MFDFYRHSPVMDYAVTHQLHDIYVREGLILDSHKDYTNIALINALEMDIYRQFTWTLCQGHLESVEGLLIPLTDIERYIEHVDRFTSLSKVIFRVEKTVERARFGYMVFRQEEQDPRDNELETERDRLFAAMVQFVQQHTSIHKYVLRQVDIPASLSLPGTNQTSTADIQFAILSLLPPLQNPRSIDPINWRKLVARLPDTNLDYVQSISLMHGMGMIPTRESSELLSKLPLLLPHCRALRNLEIETLGHDMFQWAVLEKKQKDSDRQHESTMVQSLSSWQHDYSSELVPLQSIKFTHKTLWDPVQELNDIAFAFSDSLEELTVRDKWDKWHISRIVPTDLDTIPQVVHGQTWDLPQLRILSFSVSYSRSHIDMDALQRFSALESLHLADKAITYNHRDIRPWSSAPTAQEPPFGRITSSIFQHGFFAPFCVSRISEIGNAVHALWLLYTVP
jgi:hypothetical protein